MAEIKSANISYSLKNNIVIFKFNVDLEFESRELNTHWFIQGKVMEKDTFYDDFVISIDSSPFVPNRRNYSVKFREVARESRVDTEWGKEEIYALLTIIPLESPRPFTMDNIRTNRIKVDV